MLLKFQSRRLIRRGFCAEVAVLLWSGVFGGSREGLMQTHNPRNTWVWWNPLRKWWPDNWSNKLPHYVVQLFWYNLVCQLHHNIRISHPSGGSNAVTAAHIARIYACKGLNSTCKYRFWKLIFFLRHTTVIKKLELVLFSAAHQVSSAETATYFEK